MMKDRLLIAIPLVLCLVSACSGNRFSSTSTQNLSSERIAQSVNTSEPVKTVVSIETKNFDGSAQAYNNRGILRHKSGDFKGSLADFEQAIKLEPNSPESYGNRGRWKDESGDYQGALVDYDRVIALDPKSAKAYDNRGVTKFKLKDLQGAIRDNTQAIALDPKLTGAYGNRGNYRYYSGDKQGAISDLKQVAKLFHQQAQVKDYNYNMENYQKAMKLIEKFSKNSV
jgi:tetratricopeptide (TPR) repeat protein